MGIVLELRPDAVPAPRPARPAGTAPGQVIAFRAPLSRSFVDAEQIQLAQSLYDDGRVDDAIALWQELAIRLPHDTNVHFRLAKALYDARRLPEALEAYNELLRLTPGDACLHYHLALLLKDMGNQPAAEAELRQALTLRPGSFGMGWLRRHFLTHHYLHSLLRRLVLRSGVERALPNLLLG